jgi:WD40 repeat protein
VVAGATQLSVYDSAEAGVLLQYPVTTPLAAARFVPSGREIVTGSDKLAHVWAYASPTATATLTGHQGPVYSLATSLDGKLVASASGDQTIRLWNAATGEVVRQLPGHAGAVYGVHFSDDSTKLLSTGADGTVRLWDVAAGTELKKFALPVAEGERVAAMYAASLSPSGQTVAASGASALVQVWQVNSGQAAAPLPAQAEAIYRVAYNRAGTRLLTCGHAGTLAMWNAAGGQPLFKTKLPAVAYDVSLSPDGTRVVAACADGKAYVVELPANAR